MQQIAVLNPLGDYGINQYCHELAQGLGANGARVAFFTSSRCGLPPSSLYECYPVLQSVLFKQRAALRNGKVAPECAGDAGGAYSSDWVQSALRLAPQKHSAYTPNHSRLRAWALTVELALYLKARGYGVVWTHWPNLDSYERGFWKICRRLGLFVMHTVHNVVPHDSASVICETDRAVYDAAHLLVVHSAFSRSAFVDAWPEFASKAAILPHGLYTIYPERMEARARVRSDLGVQPHQRIVLFCGGIRPYKNIDATVEALADSRCSEAVLVVAGQEREFADATDDPLGHTRRLAKQFGIEDRIRLIPRYLSILELADLFAAGDMQALPYLKSYGSGMLLLGMTLGKHIITTRTGGAEEYLQQYPAATLLNGSGPLQICDGLADALGRVRAPASPAPSLPHLEWRTIGRRSLELILSAQLQYSRRGVFSQDRHASPPFGNADHNELLSYSLRKAPL